MLMQTGSYKQYSVMLLASNVLNINNIMYVLAVFWLHYYWLGPCGPMAVNLALMGEWLLQYYQSLIPLMGKQ